MNDTILMYSPYSVAKQPVYLDFSRKFGGAVSEVYQICALKLMGLYSSSVITYAKENPAIKFQGHANDVIKNNFFTESTKTLLTDSSYQKIIAMGKEALPLIINELDSLPALWFPALIAIADVNPVQEKHKGIISEMVADWRNWAKENGYTL